MPETKLFAVCSPGLEQILTQELRMLDFTPSRAIREPDRGSRPLGDEENGVGGIELALGLDLGERETAHSLFEAAIRLNLSLRTASRILVRLGEFYAAAFSELRKKAARLEWERFLLAGQPVEVHAACHKSRLYHSDAVAERILGAIGDRLGKPVPARDPGLPTAGKPVQLILVRIVHDQVTISIDSSGEHLHRRGYRLAGAKAPLRETLAAGMLVACGWDRRSPLLDPFCGSGTIPIEAAMLALNLLPGRNRRFAFMDWPGFPKTLWEQHLTGAPDRPAEMDPPKSPPETEQTALIIQGSDRDLGAVQAAAENAARARIAERIGFSCRAVSAIDPPAETGWVVTNPPYGVRVSSQKDLRNLYAQFGNVLRLKCPGWKFAVLCSDERLFSHSGLSAETSLALTNGGLRVKLYCGSVPR